MDEFLTIKENVLAEITEKKSKFIANIFPVESKEQAEKVITKIKKENYNAKHNCIAYRVMENDNLIEKSSDDGEPSGTAGAPMLEILKSQNLCNVVVIVTRYFGGILLGTGGLVRCYSKATQNAIEKAKIICKCKGVLSEVELDYKEIGNFKYYCKKNNIFIKDTQYLDIVVCKIELQNKIKEKLLKDIDAKKLNIKKIKILCEKYINKSVEN